MGFVPLFVTFDIGTFYSTALHDGIFKLPVTKQYHAKTTWWCYKPQATDFVKSLIVDLNPSKHSLLPAGVKPCVT